MCHMFCLLFNLDLIVVNDNELATHKITFPENLYVYDNF